MRALLLVLAFLPLACRREDRQQNVTVEQNQLHCTEDSVEVDCDRPLVLVCDDDHKDQVVTPGHTSRHREGKVYRLVDGQTTVARCED